MVKLDERKIKEILYNTHEYFGIPKEEIDTYVKRIVEKAKYRMPIRITLDINKRYIVKVKGLYKDEIIAEFHYGYSAMSAGGWISPLSGDLYILGKEAYVKYKEGLTPEERKYTEEKAPEISKIQLLVKPIKENNRVKEVEILNVGENEIEIELIEPITNTKKKEKSYSITNLWTLLVLIFAGFSSILILYSRPTALFISPINFNMLSILFTIIIVFSLILFYYVKRKQTTD
jgi:hypothetical protein